MRWNKVDFNKRMMLLALYLLLAVLLGFIFYPEHYLVLLWLLPLLSLVFSLISTRMTKKEKAKRAIRVSSTNEQNT